MNPNVFLAYMVGGLNRILFCSGEDPTKEEYTAFLRKVESGEITLNDIPADHPDPAGRPSKSIFDCSYCSDSMIQFLLHGSKSTDGSGTYYVRSSYLINDTLCDRIRATPGRYLYALFDFDEETLENCLVRLVKSDTELPQASSIGGSDGTMIERFDSVEDFLCRIRDSPYELLLSEPVVNGELSLHTLALHGRLHEAPISELQEPSERLDDLNFLGDTPLHLAARSGRLGLLPRTCLTPKRLLCLGGDGGYSWGWGSNPEREHPRGTVLGQALASGDLDWLLEHIASIDPVVWTRAEAEADNQMTVCGTLCACVAAEKLHPRLIEDKALLKIWIQGLEHESLQEECIPAKLRSRPEVFEKLSKGWKNYLESLLACFPDPSEQVSRHVPTPRDLPASLRMDEPLVALWKKVWRLVIIGRSPEFYTLPDLILDDQKFWADPEVREASTQGWKLYIDTLKDVLPFAPENLPETLPELPRPLHSDAALLEDWRSFWREAVGGQYGSFFRPEQHVFPESLMQDGRFREIHAAAIAGAGAQADGASTDQKG